MAGFVHWPRICHSEYLGHRKSGHGDIPAGDRGQIEHRLAQHPSADSLSEKHYVSTSPVNIGRADSGTGKDVSGE